MRGWMTCNSLWKIEYSNVMRTHVFLHEGEEIRLHPTLVYTVENPWQASKGMQFSPVYISYISWLYQRLRVARTAGYRMSFGSK